METLTEDEDVRASVTFEVTQLQANIQHLQQVIHQK